MAYSEDKEKNKIIDTFLNILDSLDWGGNHEEVKIKFVLKGRFNLLEPEIQVKLKKRNENSAFNI